MHISRQSVNQPQCLPWQRDICERLLRHVGISLAYTRTINVSDINEVSHCDNRQLESFHKHRGVGAQSTLGGTTFLPEKNVWKINKMPEFYIVLLAEKCWSLHNNCPKILFEIFFLGGGRPVSYAYVHKLIENLGLFNYKKKSRMTFIIIIIIVVVVVCWPISQRNLPPG